MANVNLKSIRKTSNGEIHVPDEVYEALMTNNHSMKLDPKTSLFISARSGRAWLVDKMPSLRFMLDHQFSAAVTNFLTKWGEHPICPKCENILLRDKGWFKDKTATCRKCGFSGPGVKTVNQYIADGDYK